MFQICSQLSMRLEKQQLATKEELDIVRVRESMQVGSWSNIMRHRLAVYLSVKSGQTPAAKLDHP